MKYIRRTSTNIQENFAYNLLSDRGVINDDNCQAFFSPTINNEEDPMLLDNIEKGCSCLKKHIDNQNEIYLVVDPDADGYTSSALFYNYLVEVLDYSSDKIIYHIPEGKEHGLSTIIDWFPDNGADRLIILPDSSSNDYDEHKELKERGYDIIILDHHEAPHYSENAITINNQLSQDYPNKNASGVGIVYKFFECWEAMFGGESIGSYRDLVALGEISDVMQMTTLENRFLCKDGLAHLHNKFFKELVSKQSFSLGDGPLTQIGVAFYITPLINALIRVGSPLEKERLFQAFITPDISVPSTKRGEKGKEETICTQSVRNCTNAKSRQTRERDKAAELLDIQISDSCLDENKILILSADDLDVSNTLTGLCAMNVAAKYKKPVLLGRLSPDGKEIKGSIRSFDSSPLPNLKDFLQESGLMNFVEGHQGAAGFGIPTSNVKKLIDYANEKLKDVNFNEGYYEADFVVQGNCSYLGALISDLDRIKDTFGQGNPEPKIVVEDITIDPISIQVMGTYQDTVKFNFNGTEYIKFKAKDLIKEFREQNSKINISVVGTPMINSWGGKHQPQIKIDDIEIKEVSIYDF